MNSKRLEKSHEEGSLEPQISPKEEDLAPVPMGGWFAEGDESTPTPEGAVEPDSQQPATDLPEMAATEAPVASPETLPEAEPVITPPSSGSAGYQHTSCCATCNDPTSCGPTSDHYTCQAASPCATTPGKYTATPAARTGYSGHATPPAGGRN